MSDEPKIVSDPPQVAQLNALHAFARDLRGNFIEQAIWIDVLVTDILASYFAPDEDKRMLLSSDVLTGRDFTFGGRIDVLKKVVARSYPSFMQDCPALFTQLDKIRRFRNRLAHAHLDTSEEFLAKAHDDRIQITFYKDGTAKTQVIKTTESGERLKECSIVMGQLFKLKVLVEAGS